MIKYYDLYEGVQEDQREREVNYSTYWILTFFFCIPFGIVPNWTLWHFLVHAGLQVQYVDVSIIVNMVLNIHRNHTAY